MLLVNNPGDRTRVYAQLRHAVWDGWTLADFVFPLFLFLVGVCVALAVDAKRLAAGEAGQFWAKVLKRTAILFLLGLLENAYLRGSLEGLRLPGVLQRIAIVYLASVWLHVRLGSRGLVAVVASILIGYWLLLVLVPVPGLGHPSLDPGANLQGWLDQMVLGNHIWRYHTTWDPEGILSTFPAVALGLVGVLAGRWLGRGGGHASRMAVLGLAMLLLGQLWSGWFPINKSLCTSSFVLFVGGAGLALLALAHGLLDRGRPVPVWAGPLVMLGVNPLTIYVLASFVATTMRHLTIPGGPEGGVPLQRALYGLLFSGWPNQPLASLAWAGLFLGAMFLVARALYVRGIRIKA
jgi:predicted acyltransferase